MSKAQRSSGERLPTGISGFDALTSGGLPRGRVTLVAGGPGAGKTIFAMQTLLTAARRGQGGIYVCFEESPAEARANMASFAWEMPARFDRLVRFVDADPGVDVVSAGGFDLAGLLARIEALAEVTGASWVVFDGLDSLLAMLIDPFAERREVYRLRRWLQRMQLGCIITAKSSAEGELHEVGQLDGLLAFAADCVVRLSMPVQNRVLSRTLRVMKYRGGSCPGGEFPAVVGPHGISVGFAGNTQPAKPSHRRLSSGIPRLDSVLQGGYLEGSSVLISGHPGTAKTTLAGAFTAAATQRGERVLMVLFDEGAAQVRRNLRSVGLDLERPVRKGLLHMEALSASSESPEAHFVRITELVQRLAPAHLVIDPISALAKATGATAAGSVAERLLEFARARGLTTLFTTLIDLVGEPEGQTSINVSTLADTWINLTYSIRAGERNRALSVVKSRGSHHSNQVRELVLSEQGPDLTDVYTEGGEVLMGTARIEHARAVAAAELAAQRAHAARLFDLHNSIVATEERIQSLTRELEAQRAQLGEAGVAESGRRQEGRERGEAIGRSRFADRVEQASSGPARRRRRAARQS